MAFSEKVNVVGSKYAYKLSKEVKRYTLRDNFFTETKVGNFQFLRPIESAPHANDGANLKIIVAKDLTGMKLSITSKDGMRPVNIFKDEKKQAIQEQFYFIMDGLVERGVLEKEDANGSL